MDDFEQRLERQSLREIPGKWRAEILSAAREAQTPRHSSWLSTLNQKLSTVFWPHPAAWAGLTAVWLLIFGVNFSIRDKAPAMAEKESPPSPEVVAELKQQQRMLAELIGTRDVSDADRSKFVPLPRSERVEFLMT